MIFLPRKEKEAKGAGSGGSGRESPSETETSRNAVNQRLAEKQQEKRR